VYVKNKKIVFISYVSEKKNSAKSPQDIESATINFVKYAFFTPEPQKLIPQ